jgi:hypothetical protein
MMLKIGLIVALAAAFPLAAPPLMAQAPAGPGSACPAGTHYAAVRHSLVKAGQWAVFEQAVADHNAWYASHDNKSASKLARIIAPGAGGPKLSTTEAVTITVYADMPQPAHDAAYAAFTAKYRASSDLKDEARICMP